MKLLYALKSLIALSIGGALHSCVINDDKVADPVATRSIKKVEIKKAEQTKIAPKVEAWREKLAEEVADLGANNWILVTEKAFPIPEAAGVHVVHANATLPESLAAVFDAIDSEGHIWPRIYRLREFQHVKEDYAPGIGKLEKQIKEVLAERESQEVTKLTTDLLLKKAMKDFRVLIIKSESAYPYCSLYMQLDSGYWNGVSEDALREHMDQ